MELDKITEPIVGTVLRHRSCRGYVSYYRIHRTFSLLGTNYASLYRYIKKTNSTRGPSFAVSFQDIGSRGKDYQIVNG